MLERFKSLFSGLFDQQVGPDIKCETTALRKEPQSNIYSDQNISNKISKLPKVKQLKQKKL